MSLPLSSLADSTLLAGIVIIGGCALFSVGTFYLGLPFLKGLRREENNEFTNLIFAIVSTLYAILLGFVVVVVWQDFTEAKNGTQIEVTAASSLLSDAQVFPPGTRQEIRANLVNYLNRVVEDEWPALAEGKADPTAEAAFERVLDGYYAFDKYKTTQQELFYESSIGRLNSLGESRNLRIENSGSKVPTPLWMLLIGGGLVTLIFTNFFWTRNNRAHAVGVGIFGALLGLVIFLIYSLEHPFAGDVRISPDSYSELADEWSNRPL